MIWSGQSLIPIQSIPMVEKLKTVAKEAGEVLKSGFHAPKALHFKGEVDLVTEFDVAVEKCALGLLEKAFPEYTLIGEESGDAYEKCERAIYIDPIDGTTNFVHGIPFCAVSIGIWEEGVGKAGVVYNPVLDEMYWAEAGQGAFCNGTSLQVQEESELVKSLVATGFPYTKVEAGEDLEWVVERLNRVLPKTRDIRRLGSAALDLCYVAKGTFQGYYEINLKPWDISAGLVILKEAKGLALSEHGGESGLFDKLVIAGNETIARQLYVLLCGK